MRVLEIGPPKTKINFWVVLAFLLSALLTVYLFELQRSTTSQVLEETEKQLKVVRIANSISSYAKRAEGHLLLFVILRNPMDREKFFKRVESVAKLNREIAPLLTNNNQSKHIARIEASNQRLKELGPKVFDAVKSDGSGNVEPGNIRLLHAASSNIRKEGVLIVDATTELVAC